MQSIARNASSWFAICCLALLGVSAAIAQSTAVELIGTITANQAANGLGFNLDGGQDWEWAAAAAAGATHARFQCSWSTVEQQTAPPRNAQASTQYIEDPNCTAAFASAAKYGIHPTVVAAYGPPYHQILTVTIPGGASAGATSLNIQFQSGVGGDTLANLAFPYDYICPLTLTPAGVPSQQCVTQISGKHSYQGTFITGVSLSDSTHARITLASALTHSLPANGAQYVVNEILYPSAASENPTDSSIVAYGNYVKFLAEDVASHGLSGDVEIWNEPPWASDPWDYRAGLYDTGLYHGSQEFGANYGFVTNLEKSILPAGVTLTWNGTSGNGMASLLGYDMSNYTGTTLSQPSTVFTKESFHPYGDDPEQMLMTTACLHAAATSNSYPTNNIFVSCYLPGEPAGANLLAAVEMDVKAKLINPTYGIGHSVTETGVLPPRAGLRIPQARFIIRQFVGLEADGITPVEFYKLYDAAAPSDPNFSFVEEAGTTGVYIPNPSYTVISGFLADLKPISNLPAATYSSATLPSVASYRGTYPLSTVHMVGSRANAVENSDMFIVWQLSACTPSPNACWLTLASPPPAPVTVDIPAGMNITSVVNLTSRTAVSYTTSGQQITFNVADDPIEILADPASLNGSSGAAAPRATATTLALTANPPSTSYGGQVVLTAVVSPYSTKSASTNGESVAFFNGSTQVGTAPLSSGVATLNITSLPSGTNTLIAKFGGDANFAASTGFGYNSVSTSAPRLTLTAVPDQIYGAAPVPIQASSPSPGLLTYSVLSGPGRISGTPASGVTVGSTGVGRVVIQVTQQRSGSYVGATAQTSFSVLPQNPSLTIRPIANQTFGTTAAIVARANSSSSGAVTYKVVSGPAKLSGATVTLTGVGTIVIEADQAAAGNFTASSAQISFSVSSQSTSVVFASIASRTFGAPPFNVSVNTPSPGAVTYSVLSGPATVSGNTVTINGIGTILLGASLAAGGTYGPASAQASFSVWAASTPVHFAAVATSDLRSGALRS